MKAGFVIGLDFGTDSVRAVLVNASNGSIKAQSTFLYPRWKEKRFCAPRLNQYRQHPMDHIEGLEYVIKDVIEECGIESSLIKGICIDTTGSSPLPVAQNGEALALQSRFRENPNAMVLLWKDHTAIEEAREINRLAQLWDGAAYLEYCGGIYSSEWFWAKILHISRVDPVVASSAYTWMEHCDYLTFLLTAGDNLHEFKRSRCAAGHKALWHESWGGLPDDDFLRSLDPYLVEVKSNLYTETYTADQVAGKLSKKWAEKLGLSQGCVVSVGTFDAHAGAVGGEITAGNLVRVMGTSTCDIMVADHKIMRDRSVQGICGQVNGSVIPGMLGLEAGQSAFGDLLAWFVDMICWPIDNLLNDDRLEDHDFKEKVMQRLAEAAAQIALTSPRPLAIDWVNGRRTPDANQALKGAIRELSLGSDTPAVFKALVESVCFGSRMIVERFEREGLKIETITGIGGVAKKSPFVMQTLADILGMPVKIAASDQAPALGAAIYAAVAAGLYGTVQEAIENMGNGIEKIYLPDSASHRYYDSLYLKYKSFGEFIETTTKKHYND